MHGFNTFQVEGFHYPNLCARCAGEKPTQSWRIVHSTIEFPDGVPTGMGGERRNYNDYVTNVPICDACLTALQSRTRKCWLWGAVAGAAAAFFTMQYMLPAGIKLQGCLLTAAAAGATVTVLLGWVLKMIAVDGFSFAKLNGLEQKITFKNKQFQADFNRLNFAAPTEEQMSRAW